MLAGRRSGYIKSLIMDTYAQPSPRPLSIVEGNWPSRLTCRTGRLFKPFDAGYVAVSAQAAEALVAKGIRLVGINHLSVECFGATDFPAHHTLPGAACRSSRASTSPPNRATTS
jgi:hypothetical protein